MTSKARFRLLVVSHAADGTGAPISTLALCRAWAARGDVDLRILLRRDGPLRAQFEAAAPTYVWRPQRGDFGLIDAAVLTIRGDPMLALKGLRNPDRPYVMSRKENRAAIATGEALREFDPGAIYVSTTHCGDAIAPMRLGAPILTHVREMAGVISALDETRRTFALQQSAAFACVSQPVVTALTQRWNIAPDRMTIEPPAIELHRVMTDVRAEIELPEQPYIVGVGSLTLRKGPDIFLELAARAQKRDLPHRFVWLGDGEMWTVLQGATEKMGLTERIDWRGQVDNPYPYLKQAAVLALTSREDPHPRTMIEAAALGTPTIAFEGAGGADRFLTEYTAGTLAAMDDTDAFLDALVAAKDMRVETAAIHAAFDVAHSAARLLEQLKGLAA